jgi:hypothetical protein
MILEGPCSHGGSFKTIYDRPAFIIAVIKHSHCKKEELATKEDIVKSYLILGQNRLAITAAVVEMRVRSWGEGGEIITGTGNDLREFVERKYIDQKRWRNTESRRDGLV